MTDEKRFEYLSAGSYAELVTRLNTAHISNEYHFKVINVIYDILLQRYVALLDFNPYLPPIEEPHDDYGHDTFVLSA